MTVQTTPLMNKVTINEWHVCIFGEDSYVGQHRDICQLMVNSLLRRIQFITRNRRAFHCTNEFNRWLDELVHEMAVQTEMVFELRDIVLYGDRGLVRVFVELSSGVGTEQYNPSNN